MFKRCWLKFRYRIECVLLQGLAVVTPLLSRRACIVLADVLGSLYHDLDARGRAVAVANIRAAFGERYTTGEREEIARDSARNMARTFLDLFWTRRLNRENYAQWMKVEFREGVYQAKEDRAGRILMCQHFGNFEWMGLAVGFNDLDVPVIEQEFKNEGLGPIFDRARAISGNTILSRRGVMVRVFKHLQNGGYLGLLPDLTLPPGKSSTVVKFLGMEMSVTAMPAALHQRTGCQLHPAVSLPQPDGSCRLLYFEKMPIEEGATAQQIMQQFWNFFEPWVREYPHLWLWHYKHWRYRPADSTHAYPFYSNVSSRFEKKRIQELPLKEYQQPEAD